MKAKIIFLNDCPKKVLLNHTDNEAYLELTKLRIKDYEFNQNQYSNYEEYQNIAYWHIHDNIDVSDIDI